MTKLLAKVMRVRLRLIQVGRGREVASVFRSRVFRAPVFRLWAGVTIVVVLLLSVGLLLGWTLETPRSNNRAAPANSSSPNFATPDSWRQPLDVPASNPGDSVGQNVVDVDVVVYGTQTSGLAAVRELELAAPHLRVALISSGKFLETPLAQGLCVEDTRDGTGASGGFYREWREAVIATYQQQGLS
ncbi:MAG: hypothetical protein H5T84_08025, partial [Thermoleophilia bacterium]|nr:hypothetical protein [Thermoleophilia bacterium]